ncbi:MAG TPA: DUF2145 domain-containing protein [Casimicrobiaceae bacterium]|nr:DUF2145 domain-containing protein [Casimicrobiaceae bacterium]
MLRAAIVVALAFVSFTAHAGQACTEKRLSAAEVRNALTLALDVRQALDQADARVAIVARIGRDLSRYHLRYSHVAFAWRDHPRGDWTVVEELNACGTATSALFDDGFGDFFLDDMFAYEAAIVVPSRGVQRRIGALLAARSAGRFHEARYNLVAYPWSTRYQNSNQWVLETFAGALAENVQDRAHAQAWLRAMAFRPATIRIGALERLGGELGRANIAFDDHPLDRRMAGDIDVVSAESVLDFVQRIDSGATRLDVSVESPTAAREGAADDREREPGQSEQGRTR